MPVLERDELGRFTSNMAQLNKSLIDLDPEELRQTLDDATQLSPPFSASSPVQAPASGSTMAQSNSVQFTSAPQSSTSSTVNSVAQPISTSLSLNGVVPPISSIPTNSVVQPISSTVSTADQRGRYMQDRFEQLWSQAQESGDYASVHDRIAALIQMNTEAIVSSQQQAIQNTSPTMVSSFAHAQQHPSNIVPSTAISSTIQQQPANSFLPTTQQLSTTQAPFNSITQQLVSNPVTSNSIPASWMHQSVPNTYGYQYQPSTYQQASLNQQYSAPNSNSSYNAKIPPPKMESEYLEYWFLRLERWFENINVHNDHVKFNTLVGLMEHRQMTHVLNVVMNPPTVNQYKTLKEAMLHTLADSQQIRFQKLINAGELGDQKPSFRLNELRRLAGGEMNDALMKQIWLNQLPSEIRAVLAVCHDQDLNVLARKADDVAESFTPKRIAAIAHSVPVEEPQYVNELREAIEQIQREFKSSRSSAPQSRGRSPSSSGSKIRNRSTSRRRSDPADTENVCWYHRTFAEESQKCRQPCKHFEEFSNSKN